MGPAHALEELRALSTQIVEVVLVGPDGPVASGSPERTAALAAAAEELLGAAADVRPGAEPPSRVEVTFRDGAVIAVREGHWSALAVTVPEPTAGLVVYDLRTTLRGLAAPPRRRRSSNEASDA